MKSLVLVSEPSIDGKITVYSALVSLLHLGLPTALSFGATTVANTLSFAFVGGHTDADQQAAHGLAYSIGNMLVLMIGLGLINGMDTLCPAALGANQPHRCWSHLLQGIAVVFLAIVPLIPLIFFATPLLLLAKQAGSVAYHAGLYLQASLPGLIAICVYEALRKFLIYHRCNIFQIGISLLSIPFQIIFLWFYISYNSLGVFGAGLARSSTWIVMLSVLSSYLFWKREDFSWSAFANPKSQIRNERDNFSYNQTPHEVVELTVRTPSSPAFRKDSFNLQSTFANSITHLQCEGDETAYEQRQTPITRDCFEIVDTDLPCTLKRTFNSTDQELTSLQLTKMELLTQNYQLNSGKHWWQGIPKFLGIAVPSTLLCIFEWLSFEIQIFEASYLGPVQLSALSATNSLGTLIFIVSLSIAITTNGEVGRCMGNRRPIDAKSYAKAGVLASLCVALPIVIIVVSTRYYIASFYSKTIEVQLCIAINIIPLVAVILFDSLHVILAGTIKALGLQCIASMFDAVGLLCIMQIIGFMLAYKTALQGAGLIIGTAVGLFLTIVCYFLMLFVFIDWDKRASFLAKLNISRSMMSSRQA